MSGPHRVTLVDQLDNLLFRGNEVLGQPLNLDLLVLIFQDLKHFVVVEQVVDLATIYLVHGYRNGEVSLVVLPVVYTPFEKVLHGQPLQSIHCEGLARAGLPVRKNCDSSRVEDEVKYWLDAETIQILRRFLTVEGVVEFECLVVNEFGDAVDLVLAVMDDDPWVRYRDHVDLATS